MGTASGSTGRAFILPARRGDQIRCRESARWSQSSTLFVEPPKSSMSAATSPSKPPVGFSREEDHLVFAGTVLDLDGHFCLSASISSKPPFCFSRKEGHAVSADTPLDFDLHSFSVRAFP